MLILGFGCIFSPPQGSCSRGEQNPHQESKFQDAAGKATTLLNLGKVSDYSIFAMAYEMEFSPTIKSHIPFLILK